MNSEPDFSSEFASCYDEVRPLDTGCFRKALTNVLPERSFEHLRLADAGCGTGRMLKAVLSAGFDVDNVLGIDASGSMLAQAISHEALKGVRFAHEDIGDFSKRIANRGDYDIVLAHWIFHCRKDWHRMLRACMDMTKIGGAILWFDEEGDVYRLIDNSELVSTNTLLSIIAEIFSNYFEYVETHQSNFGRAVDRSGTPVNNSSIIIHQLKKSNYEIVTGTSTFTWDETRSVGWLISSVLGNRSFTNLRRIDPDIHLLAMGVIKNYIEHTSIDINERVRLRFSLKANLAIKR